MQAASPRLLRTRRQCGDRTLEATMLPEVLAGEADNGAQHRVHATLGDRSVITVHGQRSPDEQTIPTRSNANTDHRHQGCVQAAR